MKTLLCIDLSTTATGWATFSVESRQLSDFGVITPSKKGLSKAKYPAKQLAVMRDLALKLDALISNKDPDLIIVEEVNLHKSRMTGKTLDGAHWIFLNKIPETYLNRVRYLDSDGPTGWRTRLNLKLTENDKKLNSERKKINSKKTKGSPDLPIINKKHLAARYVNSKLGLSFDVDKNATDNDIVDAIGLGLSELLTL